MRCIANMYDDDDDEYDDDDDKGPKSVDYLLLFLNLIPWTESRALIGPCF